MDVLYVSQWMEYNHARLIRRLCFSLCFAQPFSLCCDLHSLCCRQSINIKRRSYDGMLMKSVAVYWLSHQLSGSILLEVLNPTISIHAFIEPFVVAIIKCVVNSICFYCSKSLNRRTLETDSPKPWGLIEPRLRTTALAPWLRIFIFTSGGAYRNKLTMILPQGQYFETISWEYTIQFGVELYSHKRKSLCVTTWFRGGCFNVLPELWHPPFINPNVLCTCTCIRPSTDICIFAGESIQNDTFIGTVS